MATFDKNDGIKKYSGKWSLLRTAIRFYELMGVTRPILRIVVVMLLVLISYSYFTGTKNTCNSALRMFRFPLSVFSFEHGKTLAYMETDNDRLFVRPPGTEHLQCNRFYEDDREYVKKYSKERMVYKDPVELPMDCDSIRSRNYFPDRPSSKEEADFPVARAQVVYMDYVLLEMELASAYQPQNHYCFAIDKKSSALFHSQIRSLASCFPNVYVTKREFNIDSHGHNMHPSYLECLRLLAEPEKKWEYVHLLQNHDTSLRTNLETVRILKWFNGSNDVEVTTMPEGRYDESLDWSFKALNLFKNDSRNNNAFNGYDPTLVISKGYVAVSLSRAMINFMIYDLNLTELVRRIELKGHGIDELLIPTLHAADAIAAPGGFTRHCIEQGIKIEHITRRALWSRENCKTGHLRHDICIYGVEDLKNTLPNCPDLFINKMMPNFDWAAVVCWYEKLFNRTHVEAPTTSRLNPHYYLNFGHVRYQYLKDANGITLLHHFVTWLYCTINGSKRNPLND
ncbi:Beta-1,3-galactosyl-O-glycosyl-glycoprotein beta-1,6-N-acetylglucosaminyltransferase 3 [Aphelenchoides besseyi]|nr:Beta-1,3-galactosyl-O-glycosyl-glycoprotein beta-1,6-N-acetylglucosaminyltransferase 3 [Aphelenchoides besseyi]